MRTYPEFKDSSVVWIGEIPTEWNVKKLKFLFSEKKLINNPQLNSGSISFGKVIYKDDEKILQSTKNSYQEVLDGEFLINPLNLNYDLKSLRIGKSGINVVVSPGYIVLRINEGLYPDYYEYFLRKFDVEHMKSLGQGVRQTISFTQLKEEFLVFPPLSEQKQISNYLDRKTQQIDDLIEKTERKIELLKEQRSSLINQCVTKGLDPNVEMKDSGVEWIGEIPTGWEITKQKFHGDVIIGLSFDTDSLVDESEGVLVLRSSNVQGGKISFSDNIYVDCEIPEKLRVIEGDILICSRNGSRNLIGKNCLLSKNEEEMTWGVFMTVFRSPQYKFFYWVFNSQVFQSQSGLFLTSTINQLTVSTLENLIVTYVRDEVEQKQISEYLDEETSKIDQIVDIETKRIDLLMEYRQSLISNVVTGKIDVRDEVIQ
jgi:type I restriction enzyme, S subunit